MTTLIGALIVALAGLCMGSGTWTIKALRKLGFEHWLFVGMLLGLIVLPWSVTLLFCPRAFEAYATVPISSLVKANLFAFGWGIANVLCAMCFVRIGVALTGGMLAGLGTSFGVTIPMLFKASGLFERAPDLGSSAGLTVLAGVVVMLAAVVLVALAGFGRDRALSGTQKGSTGFAGGLTLATIAGVLSTGPNLAFAYSQGPIVEAMKARGAGDLPATFAVWAVGMLGGALVNLLYPAYLITRGHSWKRLIEARREIPFLVIFGVQFCLAIALLGHGNIILGVLGASVGWGIFQAMQLMGNQGVGLFSGEWRNVPSTPRRQMLCAVAMLLVAASIMAYGNSLVVQ
jgi:hypothetical protein